MAMEYIPSALGCRFQVMGLGVGSWLPTMSMLTSTNFGLASYGAIFGMITLAQYIGSATGPLMGGYMYDAMQTYHWAFIIFLALFAIAIPITLAVRRPKLRTLVQDPPPS